MTKNKEIFNQRTFKASFVDDECLQFTPVQIEEKILEQKRLFEQEVPELLKNDASRIEFLAAQLRTSSVPVFDPGELPPPLKRRRRR